ncbi:hypothetical protein ABE099_05225 [Paenibacillus turicensis]|uniref:hypothetical protein n=1 Tax=Paenibacillus turicensis TaxID=160487 RepID=UPI003D2C1498
MSGVLEQIPKLAGVPGIILSILFILFKINPITLVTANPVEIKLLTKEKRFWIRLVKYIGEVSFILLLLLVFTTTVFNDKSMYKPIIAIVWAIILAVWLCYIMVIQETTNKRLMDLIGNWNKVLSVPIFFILLWLTTGLYLFPSYLVGTQIFSVLNTVQKVSTKEVLFVLGVISSMYVFMIIFLIIPVTRKLYRFFDFDKVFPNFKNKYVYIELEENGVMKRWYLNYPIDNKYYYLIDTPYFTFTTQSRFIEIEELYNKVLKIHVENNEGNSQSNQDSSIDSYII